MRLSIVVPCYNEEKRLPRFVEQWRQFLKSDGMRLKDYAQEIELVFVDDGSRDSTFQVFNDLKITLAEQNDFYQIFVKIDRLEKNQGKGAAVRRGFSMTSGDIVLMTDTDLSTPLYEFFKLVEVRADMAFGSRALPDSQIERKQPGLRPQLGRLFNKWMQFMTGLPYRDTQCGFKLLKGTLARQLAPLMKENRFAFDVEMILLARNLGAQLKEIPVVWQHDDSSRVSVIRDGIHMAIRIVAISLRLRK